MVCDVGGAGAEKRARGMAALAEPLTDDEIAELRKRVHTVVAPGIGHVAFLVDTDLVVRLLDEVEELRVRDVEHVAQQNVLRTRIQYLERTVEMLKVELER